MNQFTKLPAQQRQAAVFQARNARLVGCGQMQTVWSAYLPLPSGDSELVAVAVIRAPLGDILPQYERYKKIKDKKHLITYYDVFALTPDLTCVVMEYYAHKAFQCLRMTQIQLDVIYGVAKALEVLHKCNIVLPNMTVDNTFLDTAGHARVRVLHGRCRPDPTYMHPNDRGVSKASNVATLAAFMARMTDYKIQK